MFSLSPRKKEVFLTVASNLLLQIVTAVCGFILPPLVIGTFGSSVNGMVSSITQFIAYLNIVEAGVGGASIAALYKPLALGDTAERNAILSATSKFYTRSGFLFTILILILAIVYPLLVGSQVDRLQSALMVLVLGITGAAEFFLIGKYRVLLTADKKVYVISLVQMCALILSTSFAVVFIKAGFGILVVKLVSALMFLARYLVLAFYVRLHYPKVNFHAEPDRQAISQSKNVLVHQIAGLIIFNSPLVIITIFCSLKEASIYAVYAMVFTAINQLLGAFCNGMQSFLGESLVKNSINQTQRVFGLYEQIFFGVETWFYCMTYFLIIPFMRLYTIKMTDAEYIQPTLALLFVLVGVLQNMRNPAFQLSDAAGHFKQTQWRAVIEVVINIFTSVLFIFLFGFKGILVGALCSHSYRTFDIIYYVSKRILHSPVYKSVLKIFVYIAISAILIFFTSLLNIDIQNFFHWILFALISGSCYGIILVIPILTYKKIEKKEK